MRLDAPIRAQISKTQNCLVRYAYTKEDLNEFSFENDAEAEFVVRTVAGTAR